MAAAILLITGGAALRAVVGFLTLLWLAYAHHKRAVNRFLDDVLAERERVADVRARIVRLSDRQVRATRD